MSRTPGAKDKQKRKSSPTGVVRGGTVAEQNPNLPAGYNAKMVQFIADITPTEPLDRSDPVKMVEVMQERFTRYLRLCAERDMKVGNQGAYLAIGISKETAWDWQNRPSTNPLLANFVKKVQQICAYYRESLMADGKVNPATGIFWQKNYDGMKDQQEVVLTPNNPLGDSQNAETLKQKYIEDTYGIVENDDVPKLAESAESKNFSDLAESAESTHQED